MNKYLTLFLILFIPTKSLALIEVDITRGNLNPLPIAVSPLSIDNESKQNFEKILKKKNIGLEISSVIENNLKISGLFNPLNKDAFLQAPDIANLKPRFEDWNLIKAQALITGKVSFVNEKLRVEFRLWDVLAGKEMMALAFTTVPNNWRRVGHIITDKVYERLTGEKGYFDTRIIYVAEEGPKTKRIKKLAIMDQDGANNKFLTLGNELVLTPRFNPTSQMVTYLSYFRNLPRVYLLDIETGIQEVVGDFPGMTFAPRFSPDGKSLVYTSDSSGGNNIWIRDIETNDSTQITKEKDLNFLKFPLGDLLKEETRSLAKKFAIPVADKPESQDICFVQSGNYVNLINTLKPNSNIKGNLIDTTGNIVGEHAGIMNFTIGQRRGIGYINGEPNYVIDIDHERNNVTIGPKEALAINQISLKNLNWLGPEKGMDDEKELTVYVKIRSTSEPVPAIIIKSADNAKVLFKNPEYGVAPGQACVIYESHKNMARVLGGGWIIKDKTQNLNS